MASIKDISIKAFAIALISSLLAYLISLYIPVIDWFWLIIGLSSFISNVFVGIFRNHLHN
jgi:hypothetical protein